MVQLAMPGYTCVALHSFQHENPKRGQNSPYPWAPPQYVNNNQILNEKHPASELYAMNQKRLQKIVVKFLCYARAIDSTMLMELKYPSAVQTKPTIDTDKKITNFLNYCASHPDAATQYRRIDMILNLYSNTSYLSETEARIRAGGYFP